MNEERNNIKEGMKGGTILRKEVRNNRKEGTI